jgi:hypothetical protein
MKSSLRGEELLPLPLVAKLSYPTTQLFDERTHVRLLGISHDRCTSAVDAGLRQVSKEVEQVDEATEGGNKDSRGGV